LLDRFLNRQGEALRIARAADNQRGFARDAAVDGDVHSWLGWLFKLIPGIAHNPDDLVAVMTQGDQMLADGILAWEVLSRELRADDDLMHGVEALIRSEGAAAEQWDLNRGEIA
jgi:hypothetical protein